MNIYIIYAFSLNKFSMSSYFFSLSYANWLQCEIFTSWSEVTEKINRHEPSSKLVNFQILILLVYFKFSWVCLLDVVKHDILWYSVVSYSKHDNLLLSYSVQDIGGCDIQKQEIREAVELPLTQHELYKQIGIDPPRGVLLFGPPGTGKTMLAKAVAHHTTASFIRVNGSEFVQKYLGEVSCGNSNMNW